METNFSRWDCKEECERKDMTPIMARDLIIKCFFEAQKEMFARAKKNLFDKESTDEQLQKSVESAIKLTFKEVGGSFENPTKMQLGMAVQALARKAATWGTPDDIIEYHKAQITSILGSLK